MPRKHRIAPILTANQRTDNQRAPATWARDHHQSPISKKQTQQVDILYIDDTNLWAGLSNNENLKEVTSKAQEGINQRGEYLIAVRGELNSAKFSWMVHSMELQKNGTWEYIDKEKKKEEEDLGELLTPDDPTMKVPQLSGDTTIIQYLKFSEAVDNLRLFTCPYGIAARPRGKCAKEFKIGPPGLKSAHPQPTWYEPGTPINSGWG